MPFVARLGITEPKPGRIYVHSTGLREVFGREGRDPLNAAKKYVHEVLDSSSHNLGYATYILGIVWGGTSCRGREVLELFCYYGMKDWPGNPDVSERLYRDGELVSGPVTCGDGLILLGLEESCRRKAGSLEQYLEEAPQLPVFLSPNGLVLY